MNIFRFFKNKRCIKIFSKTYQIIPFNEIFSGKHAPELPSKRLATPRVAQPPQKLLSKRTKLNHLKKKNLGGMSPNPSRNGSQLCCSQHAASRHV